MSYSKQEWINNISVANEERMNHIEEGIYQNDQSISRILSNSIMVANPTVIGETLGVAHEVVYLYLNNIVAQRGTNFEVESGVIKCTKTGFVRINASIMFFSGTLNAYVGTVVSKNEDIVVQGNLPYVKEYTNPFVETNIPVQQNDVLKLGAISSTANVSVQPWSAVTFISVEYI
jgi:hypothetical protein